jgi:adenylate kinase family enzyme
MKLIIIGNSGSGKTWLAQNLANERLPVVHLDNIFWCSGGFSQKRDDSEIQNHILEILTWDTWIVEGIFGELIQSFISRATHLIWLNLSWNLCEERLLQRSSNNIHHDRAQSPEDIRSLIEWARQYYHRTDLRSHSGHEKIFNSFDGSKIVLTSEQETNMLLNSPFTSFTRNYSLAPRI